MLPEDLTKATLKEGLPNLLKVALKYIGRKATSELISALATHSSTLGSSGGTAGGSGQGPNEPKQEIAHLTMVASDDDEFADDPHQVIPTEDVFTIPAFPRDDLNGFDEGYLFRQR